jgi:hypothetical protein
VANAAVRTAAVPKHYIATCNNYTIEYIDPSTGDIVLGFRMIMPPSSFTPSIRYDGAFDGAYYSPTNESLY